MTLADDYYDRQFQWYKLEVIRILERLDSEIYTYKQDRRQCVQTDGVSDKIDRRMNTVRRLIAGAEARLCQLRIHGFVHWMHYRDVIDAWECQLKNLEMRRF